MVFTTVRKLSALLLGALYIFFIGFGHVPLNLGASVLFITGYTSLLTLIHLEKIHIHLKLYSIVLIGYILAGYLAITSNTLLTAITYFCNLYILSLLLITLNQRRLFPLSATSYITKASNYVGVVVRGLFTKQDFRTYISAKGLNRDFKGPNKYYVAGVIIAIPVLVIFHSLFALINGDYKSFIESAWEFLWRYLMYILNIEIIWKLIASGIVGYVFYSLLQPFSEEYELEKTETNFVQQIVKVVLVGVVSLFCLFSIFQSQTLSINLSALPFKELSMYTQRGFWELLIVSILGFGLVSVILRFAGRALWDHVSNKMLLGAFLGELLLVCLFTYHKLFSLQYFFGLKDQRVLATAAVTLFFVTFVLLVGKLLRKVRSSTIFTVQIFGLLLIALGLNFINLDQFITTSRPISYVVNGKKYKDYSYLLTNSYDNNSSWLGLMNEAVEKDLEFPENYYWGSYHSLCDIRNVQDHWYTLEKKYLPTEKDDLSRFSKYNLHEHQAYQVLRNHEAEVTRFFIDTAKECSYNIPASRELYQF